MRVHVSQVCVIWGLEGGVLDGDVLVVSRVGGSRVCVHVCGRLGMP